MNRVVLILGTVFMLVGCQKKEGTLFSNPSPEKTGISFNNTLTPTEDVNILDYLYFYNGGGVAVGDVNGDELPDIYFSGNQVKNKLFVNKGNLNFEDVTETAGVEGNSSWNTGTVMADVNGDGLLDIYVCAVVGINGMFGHNELFINNGNGTFTESAAKYGLDFDSYSSSAAFLDFDLDGDLDMYLLNHAVHTQESYGPSEVRKKRNYQTGDKLLRNDNGKFIDVSESAGIYGGINGFGLGIAISDFNQDGYPDIFVGNDFHEDDYYYLNNGNGTFTESLRQYFGHSSRFSMGNDVGDINNDGWPDIISLDMLPEDEKILKSSEGADDVQTQRMRKERFNYHYQYSRNMLFINRKRAPFAETALLSGVAATDWSWSALFGDYDQDGLQDIFVSNGIIKRPNDLDFINFASNEQIKKKLNNTKLVDPQALKLMPSGAIQNYIFKGSNDLVFKNMSGEWISNDTIISGATAMADFDLDGDLDLITNNSNQDATLYVNKTNSEAHFLKIKFKYEKQNTYALGTKVYSYHNGHLQFKEMYTARGFQSSSEPFIHFGYGNAEKVDSLKIIWPDKTYQILKNISVNQTLTIAPENTMPFDYPLSNDSKPTIFEKVKGNLGLEFTHIEDRYTDFDRQKLIPYQLSDRGPATAVGDLNNDGKEDVFFGGSKYIPSKIFLQKDTCFIETNFTQISKDSIKEDIDAVIVDLNSDGKNDLILASGGADFFNEMSPLLDSYYIQKNDTFEMVPLPEYFENGSIIKPHDFDSDGDLDLFIGSQSVSNDFGKIPNSVLLKNNNGSFEIIENSGLEKLGMITDAVWQDFDMDGSKDLIVLGEWMSPRFFKNSNGKFSEQILLKNPLKGLWQTIEPFDIDEDGDLDLVLGNWGANSKFTATTKSPLKMYYGDFDENGNSETIVATEKNGVYYPLEDLNGLSSQMVGLRKKFTTYKDFAGKSVEEIIGKNRLKKASIFSVNELRSGYLENKEGRYEFTPFQTELQLAPIKAFLSYDFDGNGKNELLAGGNYFGVKPFQGRFGSFSGAMIKTKNDVVLGHEIGLDFTNKSIRSLDMIQLKEKSYLLATFNNEKAQVYSLKMKN